MFSGLEYYHELDVNSTNDWNSIFGEDDIKFIIHGYTDRVQFNKTGSVTFLHFSSFFKLIK